MGLSHSQTLQIQSNQFCDEVVSNDGSFCEIESCESLKRIIISLKWYRDCDDEFVFLSKMRESEYDQCLVRDYQHIVTQHIMLRRQYKLIQAEISKQITPCHAHHCDAFKRYNHLKKIDLFNAENQKFCMEFMDLIHCYLMHLQNLQ